MTPTRPTRTLLMTGAGRGIGRHAALRLLGAAPDPHLVVLHRGDEDLAGELSAASGNPNVSAVRADLASVDGTREAAAGVAYRLSTGELPPLAAYVGNAGLQVTSGNRASVDGHELTFAVNVLANHVVLRQLWEQLVPPARFVITTSDPHFGDFRHKHGHGPRACVARPRGVDATRRRRLDGHPDRLAYGVLHQQAGRDAPRPRARAASAVRSQCLRLEPRLCAGHRSGSRRQPES